MNRTAARVLSVALAFAVTFSGLKGISLLAAVEPSARTPVVVLPRIEVTANAPRDSLVDIAIPRTAGNRL